MIRNILFYFLTSVFCITLASCAAIKERTTTAPAGWLEQQQQRQKIKSWNIRGRLGVQTKDTGGSVDLIWKQSASDYTMRLILPFGNGSYLIKGNDSYAEFNSSKDRKKIVTDVDNVFSSLLGEKLPVKAIRSWLRGIPASALSTSSIEWDDKGLLSKLVQSGWTVELSNYLGKHLLLPHNIYLSRLDNPDLDIRLAINHWAIEK